MSVSAQYNLLCKVAETLTLSCDLANNPTISHEVTGLNGTLTASTTVPATKVYSDTIPLVAGAYTIDLSAMTGPLASSVNFNGLKPQLVLIRCTSTNANSMTFSDGAANGYNLFGDASGQITLDPGQAILMFLNDASDDIVTNTNDEIDVAGTGTQTFDIVIVAG